MPRSLARRCVRSAPSRTWLTEPGPPGASGSCTAWMESIAITSGRTASACAHTSGSDVSHTTRRSDGERAQPVGAQPHLRGRLLRAHQQAPRTVGRHGAERLEHQGALAHARLAADQRERARHQPAAQAPDRARARPWCGGALRAGRRRRSEPAGARRTPGHYRHRSAPRRRASPTPRTEGTARAISATRARTTGTDSEQVFVSWAHCSCGPVTGSVDQAQVGGRAA